MRLSTGLRFSEAAKVFFDEDEVAEPDPDHSLDEERLIVLDYSIRLRVIVVVHVI